MGWVSPTGYNDPDNHWNRNGTPALCYDEDTATGCDPQSWTANTWCPFVEFTHAALSCDKVRHWVDWFTQIDIDVYYDGAWHDVYEGTTAFVEWVEKDIPSAPQTITAFRIRGQYSTVYGRGIFEVDFGEVTLKTSSDTGVGAEVSNVARALQAFEAGTGLEEVISRALQAFESASGVEVSNFAFKDLFCSDSGSGVEAVIARLLATTDTGSGVDAVSSLLAALVSSDTGSGVDAVSALLAALTDSDNGIGTELSALLAALVGSDSGVGDESELNLRDSKLRLAPFAYGLTRVKRP